MTHEEFLLRLVDPGSAAQGGHGPLVEYLNSNPDARATARAFGALERLYATEPQGSIPTDFDNRVLARLSEQAPASARPASSTLLIGLGGAAVVVVAVLLLKGRGTPTPAPAAVPTAASAVPAPTEIPEILRVQSTPVSLDGPPLSDAESKRVLAMLDPEFLRFMDTLAGLDPFFPENAVVTGLQGPPSPAPPLPEPTIAPLDTEKEYLRLIEWRRLSKNERARLDGLDAAFRARPADQREVLLRRWELISILSPEELAGLRRLASRLAELDARRLERVTLEIRQVGLEPDSEKREARWRALPFAKNLTGQELTAADKLLRWK